MDRYLFAAVALALVGLGVCQLCWPSWIVRSNRDAQYLRTPAAGEIWRTRALGVALLLGAGYCLYRLLCPASVENGIGLWLG